MMMMGAMASMMIEMEMDYGWTFRLIASTIIYLTLLLSPVGEGGNPHANINDYLGPQTCVTCHPQQASDALNSEHLQWRGKWDHVNTYCTSPAPADYACLSCHASTGKVTNLTVNDVDCLICHQDTYRRALRTAERAGDGHRLAGQPEDLQHAAEERRR